MVNTKLLTWTVAYYLLKLYISQILLFPTNALPVNALRKVEERGYILVAETSTYNSGSTSKDLHQIGLNSGECDFYYRFDRETSRIPKTINVAVLKDPNSRVRCQKITYEFTVLKKCDDCDRNDQHGIIYRIMKQTKVIAFIKSPGISQNRQGWCQEILDAGSFL